MKKHAEKYWAVKIGIDKDSQPYFMVAEPQVGVALFPHLFKTKAAADLERRDCPRPHNCKVVRVELREL